MEEIKKIINGEYKNHILPFLWLRGEDKQTIVEYLKEIKKSGIHEFVVEARPFEEFCREEWWKEIDIIIDECKKLDMSFYILDDKHFPTGYGNGLTKDYPQYKKKVINHKMININYPFETIKINKKVFDGGNLLGIIKNHYSINYTEDDRYVYFENEYGNYDVELIYVTSKTSYNDDYFNIIDKNAVRQFIEEVYESHYVRYKEYFGNVIKGFFSDEPGFQNEKGIKNDSLIGKEMPIPYSDELLKEFKNVYGDSYLINMHYLFNDEKPEVKYTYMDIVTRMYRDNFDETISNWCQEKNVKHIGHIVEDREAHCRLGVGCGHFFRAMANQDYAGVDAVFNQLLPGFDKGLHQYPRGTWDNEFFHYELAKLGSSLSRIVPKMKGNALAEVFGAYGWHEGIKIMKWIIDHFISRGINYFVPHAFSMADFPDIDCPPHFYAHGNNPQYKYFEKIMTYTNKLSTLFSDGKANNNVGVLYHGEAEWMGEYDNIQTVCKYLTRNQVGFDIIPTDVFVDQERYLTDLNNGLSVNGNKYQCLIIPYFEYISESVIDFINKTNIDIIFINDLPKYNFDGKKVDEITGHYTLISYNELDEYIKNNSLSLVKLNKYEKDLVVYEYIKNNKHYYLLFNENPNKKININVFCKNLGSNQIKVDLLNSKIDTFNGNLILHPSESVIILNGNVETPNKNYIFDRIAKLNDEIELSFADAKQYPIFNEKMIIQEFKDVDQYYRKDFAGTMRYEIKFELDNDCEKCLIELNDVFEIADVYVDDKFISCRITDPYLYEIDALKKGAHKLTVDVTNTLDKQVKDVFSACEVTQPSGLLSKPIIYMCK